jgi:superfamily II DNA or RNA helicase
MALSFGSSFRTEFEKFQSVKDPREFQASVVPFIQFMGKILDTASDPMRSELVNWKVTLFNGAGHMLYPHQVKALRGCMDGVVLSGKHSTGYCFMPTSGGKGHILMTLAGLAVGDFLIFKLASDTMPDVWKAKPEMFPVLISLGLQYSKLVRDSFPRTHILVHDTDILDQLKGDCEDLLGKDLAGKIEFHTVQALRNEARRDGLKYVIVDECHWGNATEEETIQSSLIKVVSASGGKAFGFTASPYPDGKFQKTWSENQLSVDLDFNYYLDNKILYPVTLREVNLQNARVGFEEGADEVDLTEKEQVIDFMADFISTTVSNPLDGPAICYFNSTIIPDMVEALYKRRPDLKPAIKVLASEAAYFKTKCQEMFGEQVLATDKDIQRLKAGEKVFLISRQKLLVGLNAPYLKYCFVSPTNSKIIIMQAIGRLMRPVDPERVPKKLAVLFLTSLSGKRLDISGKGGEPEEKTAERDYSLPEEHDDPKKRYTTTSMTLSEAYDLAFPVFYKVEVGFRDFINESRIKDGNTVEIIRRGSVEPQNLEGTDWLKLRREVNSTRAMVLAQYKREIIDRDSKIENGKKVWFCHGKELLGSDGCERTMNEVDLEIHHKPPNTFAELFRKHGGRDGVLAWHADRKNLKYLITLCKICHDKVHEKVDEAEAA